MKIGVIAGNFDVIHPGYIHMFTECKKRCDYFVVALHRDPSIERPEKLKPIFDWISGLFDGFGKDMGGILDGIATVFDWIAEFIGGVVGTAFDILFGVIKVIVGAFKLLWDVVLLKELVYHLMKYGLIISIKK